MRVVAALAGRLRSLFVPYFRYVLPLATEALGTKEGHENAAPVEAPLKKRKKSKKKAVATSNGLTDAKDLQLEWLLRFQVMPCCRSCLHAVPFCRLCQWPCDPHFAGIHDWRSLYPFCFLIWLVVPTIPHASPLALRLRARICGCVYKV